ncbi:MAG TPA: stage 0 sporulation family protein [Clostridia bacterium]
MSKVVGIRFHGTGKAYHFGPGDFVLHQGGMVIVETSQGVEIGQVVEEVIELPENRLQAPLKNILRIADENDLKIHQENSRKENESFAVCLAKIQKRNLPMNLVDAEYAFDGRKITFYFTADGRVDFRELVKDLAAVFRMRIELRQIGVRDEARMVGGLGVCGRELCCCSFLTDFVPVSIKMAKEQGFSMNPTKISGACGRLMCCFKYEQDAYEDAHRRLPQQGDIVMTEKGQGVVVSVNLLKETVTIRLDLGNDADLTVLDATEVEVTGSARPAKNRKPVKPHSERPAAPEEMVDVVPEEEPIVLAADASAFLEENP